MCAISGVLVMSLPIPIIAGNFEKFHKTQAKKNKLLKRRAAVAAARVREEKVRSVISVRQRLSSSISGETGGDRRSGRRREGLQSPTNPPAQTEVPGGVAPHHQDLELQAKLS